MGMIVLVGVGLSSGRFLLLLAEFHRLAEVPAAVTAAEVLGVAKSAQQDARTAALRTFGHGVSCFSGKVGFDFVREGTTIVINLVIEVEARERNFLVEGTFLLNEVLDRLDFDILGEGFAGILVEGIEANANGIGLAGHGVSLVDEHIIGIGSQCQVILLQAGGCPY
jgi:hypothetical protein